MREEKRYYVYIMASRSLTFYTGVTGDIYHRALQHRAGEIEGFTKTYHIDRLVYYETFKYVNNAIAREKQIKAWTRAKRVALFKTMNPAWQDLADGWGEPTKLQIPRFARDDKSKSDNKAKRGDDNNNGAAYAAPLQSETEAPRQGKTEAAPLQSKAKTA
jgi:putative endonuclease